MSETWWVDENDLDANQKAVVTLPLEGSHLVIGPPGSGKTNLLLLRAKYLYLAGMADILVIVFTRALQEFIARGSNEYIFPISKVQTCRRWQQDLLYQFEVSCEPPADFAQQRLCLIDAVNTLIETKGLGKLYDAILLDEAHDYLPEEIGIFQKLSRNIFAVVDSRQKIYAGQEPLEILASITEKQHRLRYHYRNGLQICRLADALAKESGAYEPLVNTANYNETERPSSVRHLRCSNIDDEAQRIIATLQTQLKAYPGELLGVLSPRNEEVGAIWRHIQNSSLSELAVLQCGTDHSAFEPGKPICVCTIHAAKGLEMRAVHLAGAEFLRKFRHQRNMAYTAVTRAKTSLSIYYSDDIPGYLEAALNVLEPPRDLPRLRDVFRNER
ncbi:MAG: RNA helicase [Planctomycetes bacterium]|nr:RNA helicase [Planctomycetota bacterium]